MRNQGGADRLHSRGAGPGSQPVREPGLARQPLGFERADLVLVAQRETDVVEAAQQAVFAERRDFERELGAVGLDHALALQVDRQPVAGERRDLVEQLRDLRFGEHDRQHAVLEAVVEEDVGIARRDQRAKAVLLQRPGRVLAARPAAEVLAREQDRRALVARLVQHEVGVRAARGRVHAGLAVVQVAPLVEQVRAEAGLLDRLEELLRDDRVGVDVLAVQRRDQALVHGEFLHGVSLLIGWGQSKIASQFLVCPAKLHEKRRISTKWPCTAAAAAIAGLTRCVRPPAPWRPSKLRLLVDAQRSPGSSRSAFIARHIEQPGSRHSKPAAVKILSRPSASACALTTPEPGTTIASFTFRATFWPSFFTIAAASRRSSIRLLVQLPMNTLSTVMSPIALFGARPM